MKAYWLNVRRTILDNKRRSLTLLLITAMGAAFFVGLRSTSPDMNATFDLYFDQQSMYDIKVVSTLGLTAKHVDALRHISGVKAIVPAYSTDLFAKLDDASYLFRFHSAPPEGKDSLARPMLQEGRMPEKSGECAVDYRFSQISGCQIGDTLYLSTGSGDALADILRQAEYQVTGLVDSPLYAHSDLGSSTKGNGALDGFAYIPAEDFALVTYTEAQVLLDKPQGLSRFDDQYKVLSAAVEEELQQIGDICVIQRRRLLLAQGVKSIAQGKAQIREIRAGLAQQEAALAAGLDALLFQEQALDRQRRQLEFGLLAGRREVQEGADALAEVWAEIQQGWRDLFQEESNLLDALAAGQVTAEQGATMETQLAKARQALSLAQDEAARQGDLLQAAQDHLALEEYGGLAQILAAEGELSLYRDSLADSQVAFAVGQSAALANITQAEVALKEAGKALADLPEAKCYVLGLDQDLGYVSFEQDSGRIDAISMTFPLVFFLVAALVAFTSMVRIIEDDRSAAAILQSLGYSSAAVIGKYLIYACSVGIPGTLLGIAIGYRLFPASIFNFGYKIMYLIPPITLKLYFPLCIQAFFISLFSVTAPTLFVGRANLQETTAALLRPKTPPAGRRIFLEQISPLWSAMSFSAKVTARNLLRYKKRFAMTVAGIAGCTAILLLGFGLRDSIKSITVNQFDRLFLYSFQVTLSDDARKSDRSALERYLAAQPDVAGWQYQHRENIDVGLTGNGQQYETTLVVPAQPDKLSEFIRLEDPKTGNQVMLSDHAVILSQKLASLLGVASGGEIVITDQDDQVYFLEVAGITKNYVGHYVYMSPAHYQTVLEKVPNYTSLLCQGGKITEDRRDEISLAILDNAGISALSFNERVRDFYSDIIDSLNIIVLILIISGALLAFVVLFCLTGINIDERRRELATLMVLGFYDQETGSYIFRENIVNTLVGIACGLFFGIFLHQYVIRTAETDLVMFGKVISPGSYFFAAILTFLFTLLVNAALSGGIRQINMIESLKSVE